MADGPTSGTPRTEADLLTNFFQDGQANNSITSQDLRDLIVSSFKKQEYPTAVAQLQSFTTQTAASANTAYTVEFDTQHHLENVTHSLAVDPEEITVVEDGVYAITVAANFYKTGGGTTIISLFLQENIQGAGWITTTAAVRRDVNANNVAGYASLGHLDRHTAGDKYRVAWIADDTNAALQTFAADTPAAGYPAIPSVDFRMRKIGLL